MSQQMDVSPALPIKNPQETTPDPRGELDELLGPPPLLDGEDLDAYNRFQDRIRSTVGPKTIIEDLWCRDILDLSLEVLRLRQIKVKLMATKRNKAALDLLEDRLSKSEFDAFLVGPEGIQEALLENGIDDETVSAKVLVRCLDHVERIDRMTASAESRRNAAFREIDRHRDAIVARRLRESVVEIQDAAFEDVAPPLKAAAE